MPDFLLDALIDTLRIVPYLFVTFLILELIEHRFTAKVQTALQKTRCLGPLIGGLFGALPQCGFSVMAAEFFSSKVITLGTLLAIFLSTSDEMLIIMLGEGASIPLILGIIGFKIILGVAVGFVADFVIKAKISKPTPCIVELCNHEHCGCKKHSFWLSSLIHTAKTGSFVLIANLIIGSIFYFVGTESLGIFLAEGSVLTYLISALVGLIPNCASSVILTELFLSKIISLGTLLAGLLPASGLGLLLLFKNNKNLKQNFIISLTICLVGVVVGVMVDLIL